MLQKDSLVKGNVFKKLKHGSNSLIVKISIKVYIISSSCVIQWIICHVTCNKPAFKRLILRNWVKFSMFAASFNTAGEV